MHALLGVGIEGFVFGSEVGVYWNVWRRKVQDPHCPRPHDVNEEETSPKIQSVHTNTHTHTPTRAHALIFS